MASRNGTAAYGTNFTVSIETAEGVTTGISAADPHARDSVLKVESQRRSAEISLTGSMFSPESAKGGVLMRARGTWNWLRLAELAG